MSAAWEKGENSRGDLKSAFQLGVGGKRHEGLSWKVYPVAGVVGSRVTSNHCDSPGFDYLNSDLGCSGAQLQPWDMEMDVAVFGDDFEIC